MMSIIPERYTFTRFELAVALAFALGMVVGIFTAVGILVPKYAEVLRMCVEMMP